MTSMTSMKRRLHLRRRPIVPLVALGGRRLIAILAPVFLSSLACVQYEDRPISPPENLTALETRTLDDGNLGELLRANGWTGAWPPEGWDLEALTLAALYYHPDLEVARARWAVARAHVLSAGARPNPDASVAPGYNSTTPPSLVTPWILTLGLDLTIETAGKRGHRIAEAGHLSDAARFEIATAAWRVRSDLRRSALELYSALERAALLQEGETVLESTVSLLERQLEVGAISPVELTRARLELDSLRLELLDVERQRAEARAQLASSVGVSLQQLDSVSLELDAFDQELPEMPSTEARRRALLGRADVLAALAEYAASQEALQLEIAKQYPDLHLGPGYEMDQADDKWTLGLGITLPILNRNRGPIAEAMARRTEAAAHFDAVQAAAIGEIDGALVAFDAALGKVAVSRDLLADHERQAAVRRAQYQAGEISRLELNGAELEVTAGELAVLDARVKAEEALGRLEDAMQSPTVLADWVTDVPSRRAAGSVADAR